MTRARTWNYLPPGCRDHSFFRDAPSDQDIEAAVVRALKEGVARQQLPKTERSTSTSDWQTQREIAAEARALEALQAAAVAFANNLVEAIPAAARIQHAAPPDGVKQPHRDRKFSWAAPVWNAARHDPWLEDTGESITERARRKGLNVTGTPFVRSEVVLLLLRRGEAPPFSVFDARRVTSFVEPNRWAASVYPILDAAHETDLREAQARALICEDDHGELRTPAAAVLTLLWRDLTILKCVGGHNQMRAVLRTLRGAYDLFREESK